ncbi:hypothetical protein [Glaciecola sp. HTCC2999]|mgnify:CR=1 FL=1|uniref:hypothetical protein n=1 Tax=Glaciecola sp. HTCC2999 TaxID=455436 RepID=UPI0000E0E5F0|nr:hypothetical protein [Glaciecola sp. HTCC2999]
MADENLTKLIKMVHEDEINKSLVQEVLNETELSIDNNLIELVHTLVKRANSNILSFPKKSISIAQSQLMAAAGQNLGNWFDYPLIFASSGIMVDIRKVLSSKDEVDVYIQAYGEDKKQIHDILLPFKNKNLQVRLTVEGQEVLKADIYVDESATAAEGTGLLLSFEDKELHGVIDFQIIESN